MKPIKVRTFLVQHLLIAAAITLAIIGFILHAKSIPFFPSVQAITADGQTHIEIAGGSMPFSHIALFFSFICLYLVFEFYGFKPAFYSSINIALMFLLTFGVFLIIHRYAMNTQASRYDELLSQLVIFRTSTVIGLAGAVTGGFTTSFILASAIKKLTRNYLMFIRFPIAAGAGFAVFTGVYIFITQIHTAAYMTMFWDGITPFSHFVALILSAMVPLYIIRLLLSLFRGRAKHDESQIDRPASSKTMFKGGDPKDILPPPPENTSQSKVESQTDKIKNEEPQKEEPEITVSQKVSLDSAPGTPTIN